MYRRLIILTAVVVAAVCGLGGLGFHAIEKWSQGLEGARLGEFAEVAEQVRQDVKRKLDEFMQAEQQRKYTDYLYSYVPENIVDAEQLPQLRSPLGNQLSNDFAYGYFQIEPDGNIITPYYPGKSPRADAQDETSQAVQRNYVNVRDNVLPSLSTQPGQLQLPASEPDALKANSAASPLTPAREDVANQIAAQKKGAPDVRSGRARAYPIESLNQVAQEAQVFRQQRSIVASNSAIQPDSQQSFAFDVVDGAVPQAQAPPAGQVDRMQAESPGSAGMQAAPMQAERANESAVTAHELRDQSAMADISQQAIPSVSASDTVQIRIEPFVPLVVPGPGAAESIFGGQVFLLRHVQIESRHLLQGFQLDEPRLIAEVEQSARSFMRDGMGFELPKTESRRPGPRRRVHRHS